MRIGVLHFNMMDLGGVATQAIGMLDAGEALGHTMELLTVTHRKLVRTTKENLRIHTPHTGGFRLGGKKLGLAPADIKETLEYLNGFDGLIYIAVGPHVNKKLDEATLRERYMPLYYDDVKPKKIALFTDPYWKELYPWVEKVIDNFYVVYAFATYELNAVVEGGLTKRIKLSNMGCVNLWRKRGIPPSKQPGTMMWPHAWRGWKNPELFLKIIDRHKEVRTVEAYGAGPEYFYQRKTDLWKKLLHRDDREGYVGTKGKLNYRSLVHQSNMIEAYQKAYCTLDLTGISGKTGKPSEKFAGGYHLSTVEPMLFGCTVFKYENTIEPHSILPKECVISLPMTNDAKELAKLIDSSVSDKKLMRRTAARAYEWAEAHWNPYETFERDYVRPLLRGRK